MTSPVAASLNPKDMVSGGLINDVSARIISSRFSVWDYGGQIGRTTFAARMVLQVDGEDETHEQYYSAADPRYWRPSADGKQALPTGGQTQLNNNSNLAVFLAELMNLGFPADRIGQDISVLEGLYAHFQRKPAPKRPGLRQNAAPGEERREQTILVPVKIHNLPWEAPAPAPAAAATPPAGAAGIPAPAPATSAAGVEDEATAFVQEIILSAAGPVKKSVLAQQAFQKLGTSPNRNQIARLVFDDAFLGRLVAQGLIAINGDEVSLP